MEPFLDRVARSLLEKHQHELDQVAVVLPGRRAGLHLRRYLSIAAGRTIWSPEMLDMGAFLERFSGLRQGASMEMLFMLHEAHRNVRGEQAEPLPEFLQWAPVTLRDMSEVDSHLIDLDPLYRDLRQFQEIDDWSFNLDTLSAGQQRLAWHWNTTGAMHRCLHELMEQRRTGTSGWISRQTAVSIGDHIARMPWKAVWFVGLNALDPATTVIAKALSDAGKGVLAWDADRYYLEDREQEAGRFLRRSIADLGPGILPPVNELRERQRKTHSVAVPNGVAQARHAAQLLAGMSAAERRDTAVVLAVEDLLMPLLEALPDDAGTFNVTMGMPLRALPVHGLLEAFIGMHSRTADAFHHTDVERLLLHPFIHQKKTAAAISGIRSAQKATLNGVEVCAIASAAGMHISDHMRNALEPVDGDPKAMRDAIPSLLAWAQESVGDDRLAREQLFLMARLQQRFDHGLEELDHHGLDLRSYVLLRSRMLREESIGFFGEPLSGIQIMGFLETRTIDHERIILLGANEGTLPAAGRMQSWIPFEIRRAFKLPLQGDSEAITAYHFQRMMHLARDVHLIHDTGGENGSAGPSRYVEQWRHELIGDSRTTLEEHAVAAPFPKRHAPVITVSKDEAVIQKLKAIGTKGFSPSAISTWLTCPLDLYFKYILGIRTADEVDEKLGSDVLGEAVHQVMERIFTPWIGNAVRSEDLNAASAEVDGMLFVELAKRFPPQTLQQGTFRLKIGMAGKAIRSHLEAEASRCGKEETIPLELETDVSAALPNGMRIRGRCDRIDRRGGIHHILDLKTGSVQQYNVEFKELKRELVVPDRKFGLQLLMYAWAYMQEHPDVPVVRAGIIPLQRSSQAAGVMLKINGSNDITRGMLAEITSLLNGIVDELMDPEQPFTHVTGSAYCTCCTG